MLLPYSDHPLLANALQLLLSTSVVSQGAALMSFTNTAAGVEGRQLVNGVAVTMEAFGAWEAFEGFLGRFGAVFGCFWCDLCSFAFASGKALGPIASSYLFAWSLQRFGRPGHAFIFLLLAGLCVLQLLCRSDQAKTTSKRGRTAAQRLKSSLDAGTLCLPRAVEMLEHVPVPTEPPSEAGKRLWGLKVAEKMAF